MTDLRDIDRLVAEIEKLPWDLSVGDGVTDDIAAIDDDPERRPLKACKATQRQTSPWGKMIADMVARMDVFEIRVGKFGSFGEARQSFQEALEDEEDGAEGLDTPDLRGGSDDCRDSG